MTKNTYKGWVSNNSGVSQNFGLSFSSVREAENYARRNYGSGWTVHIEKIWIDGDGHSFNPDYNEEVKVFTIR